MAKKTEKEAVASTPEEKVLSDTLMKEMKPEEAAAVKPVDQPTEVLTPPAPPPAPEETKPEAVEPAATKPKRFGWPHISMPFGKKKPIESEVEPAATEVAQQLTNEALIEMIDEKLNKISGDEFITIKISKTGLLFLTGVILVIVWALMSTDMLTKTPDFTSVTKYFPTKEVPVSMPVPLSVRVRIGAESTEEGEAIKKILLEAGMSVVDVVSDAQVDPTRVLVVTREGEEELRTKLYSLFTNAYTVASEAATLTEDSDFTATILVGKSSKLEQ